ncbi:M3 family oligoendopeptidase [Alkaliphilus peptidifermentans]|uniref:Oligoendopeptidase F n=1 Tax=Alkaliphilus peptidifermentans DSM 18978 TaxID=1120976 RepID=A0A1G5I092_9FIRM|nr:M3 family oligoendopeptidase [Alkaliphilus peptidifermentans]SCY69453.1 oligoendopeptidase F [Alkaliphilus peptidifermentans DSM 18978]
MIDVQDLKLLENELQQLLDIPIKNVKDLEEWILKESQLLKEIKEQMAKFYIDFNCYNNDHKIKEKYEFSQEFITPMLKQFKSKLDLKFYNNPYKTELDQQYYRQYILSRSNSIEIFNEKNISLEINEEMLINQYSTIMGEMMVNWEGEEKTLQQMSLFLMDSNRNTREKAWKLIQERRMHANKELDNIMDQLIQIRHQIAVNSGFNNYRDYMFKKYERFDYTPDDCKTFHRAVERIVVPYKDVLEKRLKEKLEVEQLMPWDSQGIPQCDKPLQPLKDSQVLVEGCIKLLNQVDSKYGDLLSQMQRDGMLDLDSRRAKSPGGFCSYLPITGLSFIFMNFAGTYEGLTTMVHEMGHAVHNMMKKSIPIYNYQNTPMESAELASMSMELLTIDNWNYLYPDELEFKKVRGDHIEDIIKFIPWAMTVDKFQHWMYENPDHTAEERNKKFKEIALSLSHHYEDWSQYQVELENRWKAQIHIYEVPFYYIEYAIAQLGALQVWKEYKKNPGIALENYEKALKLGSSKPLPQVYEAAGIKFDFTEETIKELMEFLSQQLENIQQ